MVGKGAGAVGWHVAGEVLWSTRRGLNEEGHGYPESDRDSGEGSDKKQAVLASLTYGWRVSWALTCPVAPKGTVTFKDWPARPQARMSCIQTPGVRVRQVTRV